MKILIVDDDIKVRKSLYEYFIKKDYDVFEATNGVEACNLISKDSFDLVILDLKMPKMSGLEVIEKIREIQTNIVVIALVDYNETKLEEIAAAGFDDFMEKPLDLDLPPKVKRIKK